MIRTGRPTMEERLDWNTEMQGGFKRMWKGRSSDFSYTSTCLIKSRLPQQTRRSRVNYSFHFCSFHRRQFFPHVTLGVFTRDSVPASRSKPGFDARSLPFIFCFKLMVADSDSWCLVRWWKLMNKCDLNFLDLKWGTAIRTNCPLAEESFMWLMMQPAHSF